jgi:hypothetical protein
MNCYNSGVLLCNASASRISRVQLELLYFDESFNCHAIRRRPLARSSLQQALTAKKTSALAGPQTAWVSQNKQTKVTFVPTSHPYLFTLPSHHAPPSSVTP